ncbi:MAG: phosphotransferase, partial [Robiginitomaculum sp.]|nr:phosphotransferase [Robiginitomaculum sp.]
MSFDDLNRSIDILLFLKSTRWSKAKTTPLAQDASTRKYERLHLKRKTAILMDAPIDADICPPEATPQQREQLGYTATARLAANNCEAFICITNELLSRGFSAPKTIAAEPTNGLVLLEDLGEQMFSGVLRQNPEQEPKLYQEAVSMLAALARCSFSETAQMQHFQWPLLQYDIHALLAETDLLVDWYLPFIGVDVDDELRQQLQLAWSQILQPLTQQPQVLVLRDFHADNLLWLPARKKIANIGLLDFQDAVFGHPAYDLVSLLQDARRDVSPELEQPCIASFFEQA